LQGAEVGALVVDDLQCAIHGSQGLRGFFHRGHIQIGHLLQAAAQCAAGSVVAVPQHPGRHHRSIIRSANREGLVGVQRQLTANGHVAGSVGGEGGLRSARTTGLQADVASGIAGSRLGQRHVAAVFGHQHDAIVGRIELGGNPGLRSLVVEGIDGLRQGIGAGRCAQAERHGHGRAVLAGNFQLVVAGSAKVHRSFGTGGSAHAGRTRLVVDRGRQVFHAIASADRNLSRTRCAIDGQRTGGVDDRTGRGCGGRAGHGIALGRVRAVHQTDLVGAVLGGAEIGSRGRNGLVGIGANLVHGRTESAIKQLLTVEFGRGGKTIQFGNQLGHFGVDRCAVGSAVGGVDRLHRQFAHALQNIAHLRERAFAGLRDGHAIVGVAAGLIHTADLGREAFGNSQTGCIVLGAVDAQAGRQALQRGIEAVLRNPEIALRGQRRDVGIDNCCHDSSP